MNKRIIGLILLFAFQFTFLFAVNRFFISDMREDSENVEQELLAKGMQSEQVSIIHSAMQSTATNVSDYVTSTTLIIIIGGSVMLALTGKEKEK